MKENMTVDAERISFDSLGNDTARGDTETPDTQGE